MYSKLFVGYPEEIKNVLNGLINLYDDECSNIILYGSAAINKLSYIKNNNKYDFLSDIEFIVVPKDRKNEDNIKFRKMLMEKSHTFLKELSYIGIIPFVDVYPVSKDYFSTMKRRISTFELKNSGKVIKGENLLALLPDVNANNYNAKAQNIEIVKALKILILESRNWFFNSDNHTNPSQAQFCYFLSSSFLNILRTLLPLYGCFELSAEDRVNALSNICENVHINHYFSEHTLNQFKYILEEKSKGTFLHTPKELFELSFTGYKSLLCMLLNCTKDSLTSEIENKKNDIFDGPQEKIQLLAILTCFFITVLDCISKLINKKAVFDSEIEKATHYLDQLIAGENACKLMSIMDKYSELEKSRWRIINSKD